MAVPILRLNVDDNPIIIVKQDTTPVTVVYGTNLIGSGGTTTTNVSGDTWIVYSSVPTGNTWGSLSGSISNQTDLYTILTGMTADILANAQCCTGNTAAIDYHYSQFTAFTDYFATLIIPAITGNTQDISDLSGAFDSHTGNTLIHFEKTDISYNDLQDLPTLFSGDYDDLTNKPDLSVYQPVSGMTAYLTGVTWNDVTNKPDLTLQSDFTGHTSDLTIHYPQSGISITESQVTNLVSDLAGKTNTGTTAQLQLDLNTFSGNTYTLYSYAKDYTGFANNQSINVAYDYAQRKITLTGILDYYWNGVKTTVASPWVSAAHNPTTGHWFLYSADGINFNWSQVAWAIDYIQVAHVYYQADSGQTFGVREVHGLMDWHSHEIAHYNIGTYRHSGGLPVAGSYDFNTATDAAVTPYFGSALIEDEDLETMIAAVDDAASGYTIMYVSGLTKSIYETQPRPFKAGASYVYVNNPSTGAMAAGTLNRWYNVYQILIPVTSDATSQKFRMVFLQPQQTYTSLAAAIAEDTRGLYLGDLTSASAEFVFFTRLTYNTNVSNANYGKVTIPTGGITYVTGSKSSTISVTGGVSPSNHANLGNLNWNDSGHISTADYLAAFDAAGAAVAIPKATFTLSGTTQALSDAFDTYTGTTAPASFLPITGLTGYWTSGQTVDYVTGYTPTLEWGNITGSISGQTDLWSYISGTTGGAWGTITGNITGQTDLVVYVNTAISAATSGMTTSLSGLTDTTITTPADNDILKYSGSTWINEAALDLFTNVNDLDMLRRSGTTVVGIPYSVMTGATGAQGASGFTPTLIFTGGGGTTVDYDFIPSSTGATYNIGITGVTGNSGETPTLIFTGSSVVNYTKVGTTYTINVSGATGAQGIQGAPGSGATILISSGATIATYISGNTTGNTWSVYSPSMFIPQGMTGITVTTGVTWTVPANVNRIWVKLWGAGGGGGTAAANNSRGGGGGGAYSESIISVSSGQTFYAIVGGGGTAGVNGGDTSFSGSTVISAGGGVGTTTATGGNGGATSGNGMIKIAGQKGGNGIGGLDAGHAGGGGGSPFGGQGGQGIGGGNNSPTGANGNAGCFPAGGGSGAFEATGTGGSGANGFILIYW